MIMIGGTPKSDRERTRKNAVIKLAWFHCTADVDSSHQTRMLVVTAPTRRSLLLNTENHA